MPRMLRFWIAAGWVLIVSFALVAALLGRIGADVRAFQMAFCVGFAGYLMLAWAVTRCAGLPPTTSTSNLGAWRWWLMGCIAVRALLLATAPGDDAYRYVWEGRIQLAGFNPYSHSPDDPILSDLRDDDWAKINHPDYPAIYGGVAQIEFLAAAAFHPSPYTVKVLHVLWDVLTIVVLGVCLLRTGRNPHRAILYGLCPLVLTAFGIEGHLDSLMLLMTVLAVWAVIAGRTNLAGVMLGLAMATKIVPVVLRPWLLIRHPRAVAIAVVVTAICYLPYLGGRMDTFTSFQRFAAAGEFFSMLGVFSVTSYDSGVVRSGVAVVLAALLVTWAWRRKDFTTYAAAATGALLMLMPVVHYWYVSWVLVLIPFRAAVRWIVMALAMVVYFEAELRGQTTGIWSMPAWAPIVVWLSFGLAWLGELFVERRRK